MAKIKLSICIPTYNRAEYLEETLQSIVDNAKGRDDVEIAVSDNASTDNTKELVENYKKKFPNIVYFCWDKNMGADRNYLKVIEIASGEYCWFMGSDDILEKGSVRRLINYINKYKDCSIFLSTRKNYDKNLKNFINIQNWIKGLKKDKVYDFNNELELNKYFKDSIYLGAVFSYISSIIFKKDEWVKIKFDEDFFGTAYSHVFVLLSIVLNKNKLLYIFDPLVINRMGNDSFLDKEKIINRLFIDYRGYLLLAEKLFLNTEVKNIFLNILKKENSMRVHLAVLARNISGDDKKKLFFYMSKSNYNKLSIMFLNFICTTKLIYLIKFIFNVLRRLK